MDLRGMTPEELQAYMKEIGEPSFRAGQIFDWLHKKRCLDVSRMTNLSRGLREMLLADKQLEPLRQMTVQQSKVDGTRKYLFALHDGQMVESVWMEYKHGNSVCISTQVGCKMGCVFCASGLDGFTRQLSAAEMLLQVYQMEADTGKRVSNIVMMGTGEPLDNYDNALRFIRLISHPQGAQISQRNITMSTCGLVPQIRKLAQEKLQITLALSLHAPNDEDRRRLMPIANTYKLEEVLAACREYFALTGRRISFEYSLVRGSNDSIAQADELARLLQGFPCHINLIPVNPVAEKGHQQSFREDVEAFKNRLEKKHFNVTIRRELGADIDGACGQLRKKKMDQMTTMEDIDVLQTAEQPERR